MKQLGSRMYLFWDGICRVSNFSVKVAIPFEIEFKVFFVVVVVIRRREDVEEGGRTFGTGVNLVEIVLVGTKLKKTI
jgi:hypothetical protein